MTGVVGGEPASCILTTKDYSIIEAMLERRIASGDAILPLLRQKLAGATVVAIDAVGTEIATLNSRVTFRVDDGAAETRTLVQQENGGLVGSNLSISTLRGLALLGTAEGQAVPVDRATGGQETLLLEKVVYQPEAAKRQTPERPPFGGGSAGRPALRLVHSAAADAQPLGAVWRMRQSGRDDDDPGPSAA